MARDGGLRAIFKKHLPDLMWVPIETWMISGPGVPDSWYLARGGAGGWVEYKKHPKRVTPEQSAFLSRVVRYGGRAFVAIRIGDDELRLWGGQSAPALARGGINGATPLDSWQGGEAGWNWEEMRAHLTR